MWETWVRSLGREDPLEEGMATHSSILVWRIPWTEEPGGLQSMRFQRVGPDEACGILLFMVQQRMGFSSLTRDQTQAPCARVRSHSHWTTRGFPALWFYLTTHCMALGKSHAFPRLSFQSLKLWKATLAGLSTFGIQGACKCERSPEIQKHSLHEILVMTVVRNHMDRVVPLLIFPTWHFFLQKAAGARAGEVHLSGPSSSCNFSLTWAIRGTWTNPSVAPDRLHFLYPFPLHWCFNHTTVGSFKRTAIHRLETTQIPSNMGTVRQIMVPSQDGIFVVIKNDVYESSVVVLG